LDIHRKKENQNFIPYIYIESKNKDLNEKCKTIKLGGKRKQKIKPSVSRIRQSSSEINKIIHKMKN
jgi:hypothetical protein